jgi:hypothetical protein
MTPYYASFLGNFSNFFFKNNHILGGFDPDLYTIRHLTDLVEKGDDKFVEENRPVPEIVVPPLDEELPRYVGYRAAHLMDIRVEPEQARVRAWRTCKSIFKSLQSELRLRLKTVPFNI